MARLRIVQVFVLIAGITCTAAAWAQTYTESVLYNFCSQSGCNDGGQPQGQLVQGTDGNLYGTTTNDGANSSGTAFKLTTGGALTTLWQFCSEASCADGVSPDAGLIQAKNGNFYGTTSIDGTGGGTVFTITPSGALTTLYSFCPNGILCPTGSEPVANLLQGPDGYFYGVTSHDGPASQELGENGGTVFRMDASGGLTNLYSFCSKTNCADGENPTSALVLGPDGNFYGTTTLGGAHSSGTFFKITPSGTLTTLYSFCAQSECADGQGPSGALLLGPDGNFYGTTGAGAAPDSGTLFKITPTGTLTVLYTFCSHAGCTDGAYPIGALILASDGNFYGVTSAGGIPASYGTVYRYTPSGSFTTIYEFCSGQAPANCKDGITPYSGVIQGKDGNLYGTTYAGGSVSDQGLTFGTVYKITGLKAPEFASISIAATPYPPSVSQPVTITATLSGSSGTPTGSVKFTSNGVALCTETISDGKADCGVSTAGLTPGTYSVTASYSGNSTYEASSQSVNATLDAAPTTTTLTVDPSSVTPPANVTLTATVKRSATGATGTPGGKVSFMYGSTVLTTVDVNSSGVATITASTKGYPAGSYNLTAKYTGDTSDAASTSSPVTLKLN